MRHKLDMAKEYYVKFDFIDIHKEKGQYKPFLLRHKFILTSSVVIPRLLRKLERAMSETGPSVFT